MEDNGLCLDLPVLDVDLVAGEDDGDVLANSHQVSVPVRHVLVRHTRGHVKHDNRALALKMTIKNPIWSPIRNYQFKRLF